MKNNKLMQLGVLGAVAAMGAAMPAQAEETIKIGVIAALSAGPYEHLGRPMQEGINAYIKSHGDHVAGKKIEVIYKDDGGPNPENTKRMAQELITRDHVAFLTGFTLTPNAFAGAPVATQGKTPAIVLNAITNGVTNKSPYMFRLGVTLQQQNAPLAQWAAKNGIHRAFAVVSDYSAGIDAATSFKKAFEQHGGKMIGETRVPLNVTEFAPYLQRVKDAHPDAVYLFTPSDEQGIAFVKAYAQRELNKAGIKVIAPGDMTDTAVLNALGDAALGIVTSLNYVEVNATPANKRFQKDFAAANGANTLPNFTSMAAYDAMDAIYKTIQKLNGKVDGEKAVATLKGMSLTSARGPITIDPASRETVQNIYIRQVKKVNGKLVNAEIAHFNAVTDFGNK